jgi:hypothetical protein
MDYDDEDAQAWQNTFAPPTQAAATNEYGPCDDYWFVRSFSSFPSSPMNPVGGKAIRISGP